MRHSPRVRRRATTAFGFAEYACGGFVEDLEPRVVPAALCDLTPVLIQTPDAAEPGDRIEVNLEIKNLGAATSPRFRVEIRLSADDIIDGQDQLLTTVIRRKIGAGGETQWSQRLKLPDDLTAGNYHIGVIVDPTHQVVEQDDANNALADVATIALFREQLTGRVTIQHRTKSVEIHAVGDAGAAINPDLTTWVVIHGRNESSTSPDLVAMAQQIDQYQAGDQILVLDWTAAAASGALGGQGENYIRPVAAWAAQALTEYGFTGQQLNLVGYSWGAEVAEELAEVLGEVNSILALDPARDYPGGSYDPESPGEVNLQAHAEQSWAFYATAGFPFGSPIVASTAEDAFVLTGSDHFGIVSVVTSILALSVDNPVSNAFSLGRLLTGVPQPIWQQGGYSSVGSLDLVDGEFDAVLVAAINGKAISAVRYFDGSEEETWMA